MYEFKDLTESVVETRNQFLILRRVSEGRRLVSSFFNVKWKGLWKIKGIFNRTNCGLFELGGISE